MSLRCILCNQLSNLINILSFLFRFLFKISPFQNRFSSYLEKKTKYSNFIDPSCLSNVIFILLHLSRKQPLAFTTTFDSALKSSCQTEMNGYIILIDSHWCSN